MVPGRFVSLGIVVCLYALGAESHATPSGKVSKC